MTPSPETTANFDSSSLPPKFRSSSDTSPPSYSAVSLEAGTQEPNTLARSLFIWGFAFFPFWFIGTIILFTPLRPTWEWEQGIKTDQEKIIRLQRHRLTEVKWAWRCSYASVALLLIVAMIVAIIKVELSR